MALPAYDRYESLRAALQGRRTELVRKVQLADTHTAGLITQELIEMNKEVIRLYDRALIALDLGTFGLCCECGGEISLKRLKQIRFAIFCESCQAAL